MSDFDHEHVSVLLNIVDRCADHSGKLGFLADAAMSELLVANEDIKKKVLARRKQDEDAENVKRAAERQATHSEAVREAEVRRKSDIRARSAEERGEDTVEDTTVLRPVNSQDEMEENVLRPEVYPQDSNTAVIADDNLRRI